MPDAPVPAPAPPPGDPPALPNRPGLSDAASAYARASLSRATRISYRSQLRAWEAWCRTQGVSPAPAAPALVANHLAELAGTRSHATLQLRLAAIVSAHALLRLPFDAADPALRQTLAGIARGHGTRPQRQAAPLLTADAIRIASVCGGDLRGRELRGERDRTLILLGFAGAFRRSELLAIRVDQLRFVKQGVAGGLAGGLTVFLPRSKGDQEQQGETVLIAANPLSAHCPVAALRSWLQVSGLQGGWVFRRITRANTLGKRPLSAEAFRLILKARAEEAGYRGEDLARITPHSLRAGCITALAQASVHERDIMKHARHGSQTVMRGYIRAAITETEFVSLALWSQREK
jgi:integrase